MRDNSKSQQPHTTSHKNRRLEKELTHEAIHKPGSGMDIIVRFIKTAACQGASHGEMSIL
jgi:hypothetical protein